MSLLGRGGMGEVYAAEDELLRRKVALKSIRAGARLDPELRARFLREARVLSQLDHPNICRIHDYVSAPAGDYIVLELLDGTNLSEQIAQGLPRDTALEIAIAIAQALAAAHAAGVVHRDVKPGNVMLTKDGTTKVLDFGLSRALEPLRPTSVERTTAPSSAPVAVSANTVIWNLSALPAAPGSAPSNVDASLVTGLGGLLGTLRYMSPEQARGAIATAASDVHSLGLVLQELFTGAPAYESGRTLAQTLDDVRASRSRTVSGIDHELARLIERAKAAEATARPTATELVERLRRIRNRPQRRLKQALAATLAAAAIFGGFKYTFDLRRERERAEGRTTAALQMMRKLFDEQLPVLKEVGRLDAVDAAAEGLSEYFRSVPREELTDPELEESCRLQQLVGDVREDQGRHAEARRYFEDALAVVVELERRHPRDSKVLLLLGAAHFYVGQNSLRAHGDPNAALDSFRAYYDAAVRNERVDEDAIRATRELVYAQNAMAGAMLEAGRADDALAQQTQVVERLRRTMAQHPDDASLAVDFAANLSWLGSARLGAGDAELARRAFEEELELLRARRAREPRDAETKAHLSYCLTHLVRTHTKLGNHELALPCATEARDLLLDLCAGDPQNLAHVQSLHVARRECGDAFRAAARPQDALAEYDASLALADSLIERDAGTTALRTSAVAVALAMAELCAPSSDATSPRQRHVRRARELLADAPDTEPQEVARFSARIAQLGEVP